MGEHLPKDVQKALGLIKWGKHCKEGVGERKEKSFILKGSGVEE